MLHRWRCGATYIDWPACCARDTISARAGRSFMEFGKFRDASEGDLGAHRVDSAP